MRIYLMARYGRRREMLRAAEDLEAIGHEVTSRWVRGEHELEDRRLNTDPEFMEREGARFAREDLTDLMTANCAIAFTEDPDSGVGGARGGRHVEAGFALSLYVAGEAFRLICVGPRENIFYCLPEWEHFSDWPACLRRLREEREGR